MTKETCEFSAKTYKIGVNPFVEVPENVSRCLKKTGYVQVTGTLNGLPIQATLVPVGKGRHRLNVNAEMRKKANVTVGGLIHLALALDTKPREVPMPTAFAAALEGNEKAKAAFEKLPPSHQKEILSYLNFLKKPETLQRNIKKVIESLLESEKHRESQHY